MSSQLRTRSDLDVLAAIGPGEVVTRRALTRRAGVSVGLVNHRPERAIRKGDAKVRQAPCKHYAYDLTPGGRGERSRPVAAHPECSLHVYRTARSTYAELLVAVRNMGLRHSRGELTAIAALAASSEAIERPCRIDRQANDIRIGDLEALRSLGGIGPVGAAVITQSRQQLQACKALRRRLPDAQPLTPTRLRITHNRTVHAGEEPREPSP